MSITTELGKVLDSLIDKVLALESMVKAHAEVLDRVIDRVKTLEDKEHKKEKTKK